MPRRFLTLPLLAFALLTSACSHYRLGTGVERDFESVFIAPVATADVLPQSTAALTTLVREAFIRDARVRVVNTPSEADAILTIDLRSLRRESLSRFRQDSGLARKFGLVLEADVTLSSANGEKTWFANRPLRIERQIFTDDGTAGGSTFLQPSQQTQAEYTIVPILGENLAEQAKAAVLDNW